GAPAVGMVNHDVRARHNVEIRFFPVNPVLGGGIAGVSRVAASVLQLEQVGSAIVPDSTAEGSGSGSWALDLPWFVGLNNGIDLRIFRLVIGTFERSLLNQEIIYE